MFYVKKLKPSIIHTHVTSWIYTHEGRSLGQHFPPTAKLCDGSIKTIINQAI